MKTLFLTKGLTSVSFKGEEIIKMQKLTNIFL